MGRWWANRWASVRVSSWASMWATARVCGVLLFMVGVAGGCRTREPFGYCERWEPAAVPYQYEYAGAERTRIDLTGERWDTVRREFADVCDATAERRAIARSVGLCEKAAGEQTPSWQDEPRSNALPCTKGQLDCIAESENTTTFLLLFREHGLLKFHDVLRPVYRSQALVFDPHRTAMIRDRANGEDYAVDSWVGKNGDDALVQEYGPWRRKEGPSRTPPIAKRAASR